MGKRTSRVTTSRQLGEIRASDVASRGVAPVDPITPPTAPSASASASASTSDELEMPDEPEIIESDIEQTRAELSETVEAIQARLEPGALTTQAKDSAYEAVDHAIQEAKAAVRERTSQAKEGIRDATIGKAGRMASTTGEATKGFGSTAISTIKQNPGPAALTALGIGWLIVNGSNASSGTEASSGSESTGGVSDATALDQIQDQAGEITGQAEAMASDAKGQVQGTASDVANQVQGTASKFSNQVQQTTSQVTEQVQQKASQLKEQAQQAPGWMSRMVSEHPLQLGAAAITVGSLAAVAVPGSQRENQLLGQARDTVVDKAEASAGQVVEKVQKVAGEAEEAAEKEAKYQGLSPES